MMRAWFPLLAVTLGLLWPGVNLPRAQADNFVLVSGGELRGELVNRDRRPEDQFIVRLESGEIVLPADQVARFHLLTETELEYEALAADLADTVDAHWDMAQWCREQKLYQPMQYHREQVIRLDPDHAEARAALGYRFERGEWLLPAEIQARRGLVDGQVPQAIEIAQRREAREAALREWAIQIRQWRRDLGRSEQRTQAALENFRAIDDPAAGPALAEILADKDEPEELRMLMVEVLGRLHSGTAVSALVNAAINDDSADVRYAAIEQLQDYGSASAVSGFMTALRSSDNRVVNRGAIGLKALGDPRAVPALIEALVTTHRVQVQTQPAGSINPVFTPDGGGGLNVGGSGGPRFVERQVQNAEVRAALLTILENGPNFNYDEDRWRDWYVAEQTPQDLELRRAP